MEYFDFEGGVDIKVFSARSITGSAIQIRPLALGISYTQSGDTVYFSLSKPEKISFEVNNYRFQNLHIFTNSPETFVPNLAETNLIYYGPGFHEITKDDKYFYIKSNKRLHIAGGAVLKTTLWMENASNITISGHGILDASVVTSDEWGRTTVEIMDSKNILVKDIIIIKKKLKNNNFHLVRADNIRVDNVKIIASTNWSDGIHALFSQNVYVNNVFFSYIRRLHSSVC